MIKFSPQLLDEIRSRIVLSDQVSRTVRLTRRGRNHVGLCPFHKEKTPSFTVVDDKGFFHCFGCGAHGDVIGFAMRTGNLSFPEAVERLAKEAGVTLPKATPADREREQRNATLYEITEMACKWFEEQLASSGGSTVRDYLATRGLSADTIAQFRLGYSPRKSTGLFRYLRGKGVEGESIELAGLAIREEESGPPRDRFLHRLMFPITDHGGRVIAFGGRAMGRQNAKYLNSPETPIFRKGNVLYGFPKARQHVTKKDQIIVVEGYMDAIALNQAGIRNVVAPLGTAVTEMQLGALWRVSDEPVICLDGDAAGYHAACRVVDRALPILSPGKSLQFALIPDGQDPDELISENGVDAMRQVLDRAQPMVDLLWKSRMDELRRRTPTPERTAKVEKDIKDAVATIRDKSVRYRYNQEIYKRLRSLTPVPHRSRPRYPFGPDRRQHSGARRPQHFGEEIKPSDVSGNGKAAERAGSERVLVALPILVTGLLERVVDKLSELDFQHKRYSALQNCLINATNSLPHLDSASIRNHLETAGMSRMLEALDRDVTMPSCDPVLQVSSLSDAERLWNNTHDLYRWRYVLRREISAFAISVGANPSPSDWDWQRFQAQWEESQELLKALTSVSDGDDDDKNAES